MSPSLDAEDEQCDTIHRFSDSIHSFSPHTSSQMSHDSSPLKYDIGGFPQNVLCTTLARIALQALREKSARALQLACRIVRSDGALDSFAIGGAEYGVFDTVRHKYEMIEPIANLSLNAHSATRSFQQCLLQLFFPM
jgi:hypothetical protein